MLGLCLVGWCCYVCLVGFLCGGPLPVYVWQLCEVSMLGYLIPVSVGYVG